jgi:hypothetical protein
MKKTSDKLVCDVMGLVTSAERERAVGGVNRSRNGRSYAVMFENASWNHGLKMVVFRGAVAGVGGSEFLVKLRGRTIRVRGLLSQHHIFGYQIIVKDRSMILEVR